MATERYFVCPTCGDKPWTGKLIDIFREWTEKKSAPICQACAVPYELRLNFPFSFGADGRMRVLNVFAPRTPCEWEEAGGKKVSFHPFLVIGETVAANVPEQTAWLPYWHIHDGRPKFGQWAPNMDLKYFAELVDQAREHNYLV
ncbi:MAG TPA: hypothetical protein VFJ82_01010 [Longimicrobium sp.]|nr:hypothetical protein [Longimicrobium sp.]